MLKRRYVHIILSVSAVGIILTQFQNCAPATPNTNASGDGDVQLIDDFNKSEIRFVSESVQVHDEAATTGVSGMCNRRHSGAPLHWTIVSEERASQPLLAGESSCKSGRFRVELPDLPEIVCGVKHLLVVEGSWGGSTHASLVRRCQPLASEEIEPPQGTPIGTSCALEYQAALEATSRCTQVCYRDAKVVSERALPSEQCSGLADKLAGP